MSDNSLIQEDSLQIGKHLSNMQFGDHNLLLYSDINSLRTIYSSHSKQSLHSRNNAVIILYHYEIKASIVHALQELDIAVDCHEADRSLIILDADEIICKLSIDNFLQYLKTLEGLAIKYGRNGIDVIIDMGSFRHLGKEQELLECERKFNTAFKDSKSSTLCCYHDKDIKALAIAEDEIYQFHLKNYIVREQQ